MNEQQTSLDTLKDIRSIMERSSRFISLSGWSGVSAGICALLGAYAAQNYLSTTEPFSSTGSIPLYSPTVVVGANGSPFESASIIDWLIHNKLFQLALFTFLFAFASAYFFTYIKTKKMGIKNWDKTSMRLMANVALPMAVGGLFIFRLIELGWYGLITPACLIFYGLALLNASKYTYQEIRWLGLMELILGIFNCWNIKNGLYYWAIGFGVLHIIYGVIMWWKYERGMVGNE